MPFTLQLQDARTDLINLAGIDGHTGPNGRHSPANLNRLLNRKYRALLSRVRQSGPPQSLESVGPSTIPVQTAGEDFIEIPMNGLTSEVLGVDVLYPAGKWSKLDPIEFEQRRDFGFGGRIQNYPFYLRGQQAPNGVGWWSVIKAPKAVNTTTITAGSIAIWPPNLSGQYKLFTMEAWTDLTADTNVFLCYEAWDDWLLYAAAMVVCTRDKKDPTYIQVRDGFQEADALVVAAASRLQRGGFADVTSYKGIVL